MASKDEMRRVNEEFAAIVEKLRQEHDGALRRLAESERIDRERFEQGLDSKYGWPEDDEDAEKD